MHDPGCKWPAGPPCLRYSTDGTKLGAEIAHTMECDNEDEITRKGVKYFESDIGAEQADWDRDDATDS